MKKNSQKKKEKKYYPTSKTPNSGKKKSRSFRNFVLVTFISVVMVVVISVVSLAAIFLKFNHSGLDVSKIGLTNNVLVKNKNIENIALFGIDSNNVADAIAILGINKRNGTVNVVSILRDSLVEVEPEGSKPFKTKINEAYCHGGEQTLLKALNRNFNLSIKNYITVNYRALIHAVNAIGGVTVEITPKERRWINSLISGTSELKGKTDFLNCSDDLTLKHTLDGEKTLAYLRIRKVETPSGSRDDFGRTDRQREIMEQIFNNVKNNNLMQWVNLIRKILPYVKTSYNIKDLVNMFKSVADGKKFKFRQTRVPHLSFTKDVDYRIKDGETIKSTVNYDTKYAGKLIKEFIENEVDLDEYLKKNPPKKK